MITPFTTKQDSLASSRHNPDFMDRTFVRRLEIEDRLSAFRRLLAAVVRRGDESGFEELWQRVKGLDAEVEMIRGRVAAYQQKEYGE